MAPTGVDDDDDAPATPRAFPLSSLGPEVRELLWVPPSSGTPREDEHADGGERAGADPRHVPRKGDTGRRAAASPDHGDEDEGWSFTSEGLIDWNRAPSPPPPLKPQPQPQPRPRTGTAPIKSNRDADGRDFDGDGDGDGDASMAIHAEAATMLKGLARASLRRIRSGSLNVLLPEDGAAHADLLRRLMRDMQGRSGGGGKGTPSPTPTPTPTPNPDASDSATSAPASTPAVDSVYADYLALALSLSVVERRCVDLHVAARGGAVGVAKGLSPMLSEVRSVTVTVRPRSVTQRF